MSALESAETAEALFGSPRRPGFPPCPCGFAARVPHPVRRVRRDIELLAGSELSTTAVDLDVHSARKDLEVEDLTTSTTWPAPIWIASIRSPPCPSHPSLLVQGTLVKRWVRGFRS